ncbi:MAG TPA: TAXI family TRAP transporter solute-binding subunit [Burkholderiaceae bacterium]|nr:TAXI family TRAP transporter solute-binding subunit [Burkholderiaceae bacterium]
MKRILKPVAFAGMLAAAGIAHAQVLGLGTAQAGATVTIGQTIAKIVSEATPLQMRTQAFASTGQYGPRVNAGELDFGVSNVIETYFLHTGEQLLPGKPQKDLRLAMVLYPLPVTFFTPQNSPIKSAQDIPGKRVPVGWASQPLGRWLFEGFFANQGIPYESVAGVPVTAMPRMWDMFGQNQLDVALSIYGSSLSEELASKVGGLRYFDIKDDPAAVERMRKHLPFSYVSADTNPRTGQTVKNISYDFVLFTSAKTPDDVVYNVVKALHTRAKDLEQLYSADKRKVRFAVESGIPFHPGAERLYKEVGLWPPAKAK